MKQKVFPVFRCSFLSYLQVVEGDVSQEKVHFDVIEGFLIKLQWGGAEGNGFEEEVLGQFTLPQVMVDDRQAVVGHSLT